MICALHDHASAFRRLRQPVDILVLLCDRILCRTTMLDNDAWQWLERERHRAVVGPDFGLLRPEYPCLTLDRHDRDDIIGPSCLGAKEQGIERDRVRKR